MGLGVRARAGRLLVGLAVTALLGGCAAGASPTPAPASASPAGSPSAAVATPIPTAPATARPAPTPSVVVTTNLAYESSNPVLTTGVLDVYAPAKAGPWPVVVMFHGGGNSKTDLTAHARRVADLGFVVFNATWGAGAPIPETYEQALPITSQAACAVEFARAHAAEYGGDPATMIVFGHSFGANFMAAMIAFARPDASAGCLGSTTPGAIDALVTWEGDWLLQPTTKPEHWDKRLAADPTLMDALTPWKHLPEHRDLKVVMLVSEHPYSDINPDRPLPDPEAMDAFFAPRDPSGVLRRQLEVNGALADGNLDLAEAQGLLFSVLEAQGNPVSLDVMPDSNHISLSEEGWKVFLAAFPKAAAQD
jgi:acetyl esterase/lipase